MPEDPHPPAPGSFVTPNFEAIELAIDRFTFPISKRDMLDAIDDEESVLVAGRNVELRALVRDLHDDFFDTEDEFRDKVQDQLLRLSAQTAPAPDYPGVDTYSSVEHPDPDSTPSRGHPATPTGTPWPGGQVEPSTKS